MEIRIDTSKDSKEEIRKAINFLNSLLDNEVSANNNYIDQISGNSGNSQPPSMDIFATPTVSESGQSIAKKKRSPEEELFGDDSIQIIPY